MKNGILMFVCLLILCSFKSEAAEPTIVEQVTNLTQYDTTNSDTYHAIYLRWNAISEADGYEIQTSTDKTTWKTFYGKQSKKSMCKRVLYGFKASSTYYVRVRAYTKEENVEIYGEWSSPLEVVTAPKNKPTKVKATSIETDKATITWNKVSGADSYVISYGPCNSKKGWKTKTTSKNKITLTGLSNSRKYSVIVYSAKKTSNS